MDSFSDVFERVKQLCRGEMSEVAYDLWIRELELTALDSSTACLQCTTQFKRDIVNEKYNALLTASFEEIMGFPVQVEITSREAAPAAPAAQENNRLDFQPEKEYSFETFVVGSGNSLAHAAAWAVANNPAKSYNPLFMYGGSGLGKTHLIYAICGKIRQNHPDYKLLYVKGEEFANELILAIRNGTTAEFKEKYRQADLLAVDDIQFIAGKESTQEEFFHTFNSLYECGKQIILTSDRPPKEIKTLEDRLRTRFEWGLLVDVQPPDFETRMAIISRKADSLGLALPEDVAAFIAGKLKDNVRQLEGVVKRLDAHANLTGAPITMLLAENAIQDIMTEQTPLPVTVDRIIDEVARTYGVTAEDIRGQRRSNQISTARQVAMYVVQGDHRHDSAGNRPGVRRAGSLHRGVCPSAGHQGHPDRSPQKGSHRGYYQKYPQPERLISSHSFSTLHTGFSTPLCKVQNLFTFPTNFPYLFPYRAIGYKPASIQAYLSPFHIPTRSTTATDFYILSSRKKALKWKNGRRRRPCAVKNRSCPFPP